MKISVVLATYNGELYVFEQLESILNQTRQVDEVIVCDDRSTDNTKEIVNEFIKKNNLTTWVCILNKEKKGFRKNFIDGIYLAKGEIIFLADQDDIWIEDRVEIMASTLEENNNILALAGLRTAINENGQKVVVKYPWDKSKQTKKIEKIPFRPNNCTVDRAGCVTCFRKNLIKHIKPLWVEGLSHDYLIWRLACILDGAYDLDYIVLKYRIHCTNTSGVSAKNTLGQQTINARINDVKFEINWFELYINYIDSLKINNDKIDVLIKYITTLEIRNKFLRTKKLRIGFKTVFYIKYYSSLSKFIGDFAYVFGMNNVLGTFFGKIVKK